MKIIKERLNQLSSLAIQSGSHDSFESGACTMELVSWVAGEPFSDAPQCACPVITAFMVSWNDSLPSDEERDRLLKPLIPLIVGTRSTPAIEERRSYMALDWLIRVYTPKWLDTVPALHEQAKALRELDVIADRAGATAAGEKVRIAASEAISARVAARDAAWDAAGASVWDAAWDAARDAAGDAAGDAASEASSARDAAGDAAWAAAWAAAEDAARDAAWAAARGAVWDAAGAAARAALKPTTQWLQAGAAELVKSMCEVKA